MVWKFLVFIYQLDVIWQQIMGDAGGRISSEPATYEIPQKLSNLKKQIPFGVGIGIELGTLPPPSDRFQRR